MMNISIKARDYMISQVSMQTDHSFGNDGIEHMLLVAQMIKQIATKRNLDVELCLIAAYLHDIATYTSHYSGDHARRSGDMVKPFLLILSPKQREIVYQMIVKHSDKDVKDDDYCEALKDADACVDVITNGYNSVKKINQKRYDQCMQEASR